jgi:hypothetical protein
MSLINATSVVAWFADSITSTFTGSASVWVPVAQAIRRRTLPDENLIVPSTRREAALFCYVSANSGRAYKDIGGTFCHDVMAGFARRFTHVVFQLGINDASLINSGARPPFISSPGAPPSVENDINVAVASALSQSPAAIPVFIGPWAHDAGDFAVQIAQVNTMLQAKATATGGHFILWSDIPNTGGNSTDGVHPTVLGAQVLANRALLTL